MKFTPGSTGPSFSNGFIREYCYQLTPTAGALSGTGTPAPVHSVALSWTASATSGITSYNVYRAVFASSVCGSYANVGTTASSITAFTDNGPLLRTGLLTATRPRRWIPAVRARIPTLFKLRFPLRKERQSPKRSNEMAAL